jgi:hypothetical protein
VWKDSRISGCLVGAVGIETSVIPTSPADSIALAPSPCSQIPTKTGILRPSCDQKSREFSDQYRLRVTRDHCGYPIIRGKFGHIYEHGSGIFGIVLEAATTDIRYDTTLRSRKRRAVVGGFVLHQEGDCEAILLFDPSDSDQAQLAIRLIEAKKIRKAARPTDAQLRSRTLFSSRARSRSPCFEQDSSAPSGARG